jgi:nicotinamide riboside kinase/phosphopantetheinyl transferase (holo-ACP synthase)
MSIDDVTDSAIESLTQQLHPSDIERINAKSPSGQRASMAARMALASACNTSMIHIHLVNNKPVLSHQNGHVSMSHGGQHAVGAWHPSLEVGIDIESDRGQLAIIAPKFLSDADLKHLKLAKEPQWMRRVAWGAKEAVYKAASQSGLVFSAIAIDSLDGLATDGHAIASLPDHRQYAIHAQNLDGHCLVTAVHIPTSFRVVITGPESSGKTTLSMALSKHLKVPLVPEYSRIYLTELGEKAYGIKDLQAIAKGQLQAAQKAQPSGSKLCIEDSDLLTLVIWCEEKFGRNPDSIQQAWDKHPGHLYLLCAPDMPWEADPLRESPEDRDRLYGLHRQRLVQRQLPFIEMSGSHASRMTTALEALNTYLYLTQGCRIG